DGDVGGIAGEGVAAFDAALRAQDARAAQDREELLEELDGDLAAARELADRRRPRAGAAELGERLQRVGRLGGDRGHAGPTRPAGPGASLRARRRFRLVNGHTPRPGQGGPQVLRTVIADDDRGMRIVARLLAEE